MLILPRSDPAVSATILLYMIEPQERYIHLTGFTYFFAPLPPSMLRQVQEIKEWSEEEGLSTSEEELSTSEEEYESYDEVDQNQNMLQRPA